MYKSARLILLTLYMFWRGQSRPLKDDSATDEINNCIINLKIIMNKINNNNYSYIILLSYLNSSNFVKFFEVSAVN